MLKFTYLEELTCRASASERDFIDLLAGVALPKSIIIATGKSLFLLDNKILPGFRSL
jgi:hypothetical protein